MFSRSFFIWLLAFSFLKAEDTCDSVSLLQTASSVHNWHSVPGRFFEDSEAFPVATAQTQARRQVFEAAPVARFDVGVDAVPLPKPVEQDDWRRAAILTLAQTDATSNLSKSEDHHSVIDIGGESANGTSQVRSQQATTASEKEVPKVTAQTPKAEQISEPPSLEAESMLAEEADKVTAEAPKVDQRFEPPVPREADSTLAEKVDNASPSLIEVSSAEPPLPPELLAIGVRQRPRKGGDETHNVVDGPEQFDVASKFVECLGDSSDDDCNQDVQQKDTQAKAVARLQNSDPNLESRGNIASLRRENARLDAIGEIDAEERSLREEERTRRIMSRKLEAIDMERRALLSQAAESGWLTPDDNIHMSGQAS